MPRVALVLGYAGLLPVAAAIAAILIDRGGGSRRFAGVSLVAEIGYAALILSFLGGMWWGQASRSRGAGLVYVAAVVPSLLAVALFTLEAVTGAGSVLPLALGIGVAVLATLPIDRLMVRRGLAPGWWMRLRVPLSLGLGLGTILVGLLATR